MAKSILIIDDDQFLLNMYATKFRESGFEVRSALHASDAVSLLEDESLVFDVVLFDLNMPGIDGFELLRRVREEKLVQGAAKIVLSNSGEQKDIDKAKELGVNGYIIKASSIPSEVVDRVKEIMQNNKRTG